ncbi:hypothetical protein K7432_002844 [Basidiobolus ranarum]
MSKILDSSYSNLLASKDTREFPSDISRFSPNEWIEIKDPQSTEIYYANPFTGDCAKTIPANALIHPNDPNGEWWELYDEQNDLNYYYNTLSCQTEWIRPEVGLIIPLAAIQNTAMGRRVSMVLANRSSLIIAENVIKAAEKDRKSGIYPLLNLNNSQHDANSDELKGTTSPQSNPKRQDGRWSVSTSITETSEIDVKRVSEISSRVLENSVTVQEPQTEMSQGLSSSDTPNFSSSNNAADIPTYAEKEQFVPPLVKNDSYTPATLPPQLLEEMNQFKIDGFAQKYFSVHKKGLFRRKISVEKLLQWSKDSLKQPLLVLNKSAQRDALKCFKIIQKIMGDRAHIRGFTPNKDTQWLLERAISLGELRDELYVQLCKQLTHNPNSQSLFNGWQLMCVFSVTFPPSKNFEKYMQSFIKAHFDIQQSKIDVLSKHAYNKLLKISKSGPRGKVLTSEEIEQAKESAFHPTAFGESLEYVMQLQAQTYPDLKIPRILLFLAESVLKLDGQKSEGIFRLSGDPEAATSLRLKIEKNQYDIQGIADPNVPSSLLKFWLRDLAEPLIPAEF